MPLCCKHYFCSQAGFAFLVLLGLIPGYDNIYAECLAWYLVFEIIEEVKSRVLSTDIAKASDNCLLLMS